jgi:hypothetical protein
MRRGVTASIAAGVLAALASPAYAAPQPATDRVSTRSVTDISASRRHHAVHARRAAQLPTYKPPYYGRAYRPYAYGWAPPYAYNPYGGAYAAAPFPYFPFFGYGWAW